MNTAEAAQKWAEAKDTLAKAVAEAGVALERRYAAELAEREAWDALEALAGRTPVPAVPFVVAEQSAPGASSFTVPRARMNGGVIERE